ncbi:DUF2384 domain-containing protein [Pseudoxanthomonas winnipegensis]|uniref:type II RES/Xre toxin-antitoxin system antitoxin n=1 Tax=Pseudoxanthomonas winnipegensis TaxID=2480810 RepID=UPI0025782FD7|nr:antitoxin Xre/MbcA/ParS toxin-binding domain-containing protein [Pseudoxanthomonas winnipegensis]WJI14771.1 DUF2384 domain-containing protein [Pseudoxanthomonas winnipegensis]
MSDIEVNVLDYLGVKRPSNFFAKRSSLPPAKKLPGSTKAKAAGALSSAARRPVRSTKPGKVTVAKGGRIRGSSTAAEVLPLRKGLPLKAVAAVQLPGFVITNLARKLDVTPQEVLSVSSISPRTYHRRQENDGLLTETESDRVMRIARLARQAERVFGDAGKASRWLSTPNRILGNVPLQLLATDAGAHEVEDELGRIEYGDFA